MAIESKTFMGTNPPVNRTPNVGLAVAALNQWRDGNLHARIISIETLNTDSGFDGIRVWFEQ
jgi:hypothetical protein